MYKHGLPSWILRKFYVAFVRPRLKYCYAVWGRVSPGLLSRLQKLQLQVACAIARPMTPMFASQLLESLGLPTLAWRRRIRRFGNIVQADLRTGSPKASRDAL